jgi:hypothetical protein
MRGSPQVMLELCDAARRLGMGQKELEAMIATGQVEALRGEFLCLIPRREVERLTKSTTSRFADGPALSSRDAGS